jgi:dihydroxyacetone kinase DhaKLM complex PTS-EIIA-like component DhaM
MRFHGMMLVRGEEDILPQCLDHLLTWIDALYIMDLGSTDMTWQVVQDYAAKDKRIVPILSQPIIYGEGVRSFQAASGF